MAQSGNVWLFGDTIRHEWPGGQSELGIDQVRVIGETSSPPSLEFGDRFVCFASAGDGWYQACADAVSVFEVWDSLASRPGADLTLRLCASTDESRVLWPPELAGGPMFTCTASEPPSRIGRAIVRMAGGPFIDTQRFAPEVERYLRW